MEGLESHNAGIGGVAFYFLFFIIFFLLGEGGVEEGEGLKQEIIA